MTDFSGSGVDTTEERKPGKLVKPGIHVLKIANVEYIESSQQKTPGIKFTLETAPVEGLKDENGNVVGQKCTDTMWLSPKAWDNDGNPNGKNWCTKARLAILSDKLGVRDAYDATTGNNAEEFVNNLVALFKGKKARFAIGGEESSFTNDEGEVINVTYPNLLTYKFVESIEEVPNDADTQLKYDENNQYHLKKREEADDTMADIPTATPNGGTEEVAPW